MESRETEVLKELWKRKGKAHISAIARSLGINTSYAETILDDMGEKDYIDISRGGLCKLAKKGKDILKNRGLIKKMGQEEKKREIKKERSVGRSSRAGAKFIKLEY